MEELQPFVGREALSVFVAGVLALASAHGHKVASMVSADARKEFVPRIQDPASGRWLGIVEPSASDPIDRASRAIAAGACGVVLPDTREAEFGAMLDALRNGDRSHISPGLARALARRTLGRGTQKEGKLTPRELQVLRLVGAGSSNGRIAADLGISTNTVRTHLRSLGDKLGMSGKPALAVEAWSSGYMSADSSAQSLVPTGKALASQSIRTRP